mgnify:CR=1 FL=1
MHHTGSMELDLMEWIMTQELVMPMTSQRHLEIKLTKAWLRYLKQLTDNLTI